MALNARLELRQGQSLVITPQLQQAIKLLQLSNLELDAYVEAEIERNPLLARDDRDNEADSDQAPIREAAISDDLAGEVPGGRSETDLDARHDDLYADASPGDRATGDAGDAAQVATSGDVGGAVDWSKANRGGSFDTDGDGLDGRIAQEKTLAEFLDDQAAMAGFSPSERLVANALIGAVDEGGYLRASVEEVAERLGCGEALIELVLSRLQGFEPTGVFARDVRECLRLQLIERDRCDPAMQTLLDNLELLARRDMAALKRLCGVDDEDLRDMITEIKALTPATWRRFRI